MGQHRVLIEVTGGVADWAADEGVEVLKLDYDDEQTGMDLTGTIPSSWRDLVPHLDEKYFKSEP